MNTGSPIGTEYTVTEPARLAYWDPSIEIPASTSTRRAAACPWYAPKTDRVASPYALFTAMFSE